MATPFNSVNITKFEMGAEGADGAMGTSLTQYNAMKEGTVVLGFEAPTTTDINIEESNVAFYIAPGEQVMEVRMSILGLAMSDLVTFRGGTYTAGTGGTKDTWDMATSPATILQSVKLTSATTDGDPMVRLLSKCQIFAFESQTLTKTDAIGLDLIIRVLIPVNSSGVPQTPVSIEGNTVT